MGFLNFMKKKEELPADIDLDMPPEPPKIGLEKDFSAEYPIDEELMPLKRRNQQKKAQKFNAKKEKMKLPELPPLPEVEAELPELPPLPEADDVSAGELPELPPLPDEENFEQRLSAAPEKKKGLFSLFKKKQVTEKAQVRTVNELPLLPEIGEESEIDERLPELPQFPDMEEISAPIPITPEPELPISRSLPGKPSTLKIEKPKVSKPIVKTKFITISEFRNIQSIINDAKSNLKGIDVFFSELAQVKSDKDKEYTGWYNALQDIQRKIMFVDKTLFEEV